jgi:hypothetical protein
MIKPLAREIFGNRAGTKLSTLYPELPAVVAYLRIPSGGFAQEDLRLWYAALKADFGPKRFTELNITYNDVYKS